jgi:TolA-binding protein
MMRSAPSRVRELALAALCLAALGSCAPSVAVRRRDAAPPPLARVGVLLFDHGGVASRREAEVVTEVFSLEMRRYFPDLVERFEIEEALAKRDEAFPTTLSPAKARALGAEFGCDAFFVGRITSLRERASLLGVRGGHQFGLMVTLVSARDGSVILTSNVDSEGTFLMPLETTKEIAIYSVRKLAERLGFEEKEQHRLSRSSPLWIAALRAYEERRFWDAACLFGESITQYPVSVLTEEAYLYVGRSFYELSMPENARQAWESLAMLFPKSEFHAPALAEMAALAYRERRRADGDSLLVLLQKSHPKDPSRHLAAYAAGVAAKNDGEMPRALRRLATVPPEADYGPHARYAEAECRLALGEAGEAAAALARASQCGERSLGHAALAATVWAALGRYHLQSGDNDAALAAFRRVPARDDIRGDGVLGLAWVLLGTGDAAGALNALDGAPAISGIPRVEAGLLRALALDTIGERDAAVASLRETDREIAAARGVAAGAAARGAEVARRRASLTDLAPSAWATALARPSAERDAARARIGAEQSEHAAGLARAQTDLAAALEVEAESGRLTAMAERSELLLANLLLEKGRTAAARAPSAAAVAWPTAVPAGAAPDRRSAARLLRRDGSSVEGDVVSLALSDVGFRPAGSGEVLLVPRAEVHRVEYDDGRAVEVGPLHSERKELGLRAAYLREVTRKPYLLETELQLSRRDIAERSILRGFLVASVATLFTDGDSKYVVFPAVFAGQFALAYVAGR